MPADDAELNRYIKLMDVQARAWEDKCTRCGSCCGALDDPCENLRKDSVGKYHCADYKQRFGQWHTVSGKVFSCVPIRFKIAQGHSWPGDEHCGYKR